MDGVSWFIGMVINLSTLLVFVLVIGKLIGKFKLSWWWIALIALPFILSLIVQAVAEQEAAQTTSTRMSREEFLNDCNSKNNTNVDLPAFCKCSFEALQSEDGMTLAEWTYDESNEERGTMMVRQCAETHAL